MSVLKASTVQELTNLLLKFDKNLPVAVFDCDRGYMSVAFKKEEHVNNGKTFQWLTFYAHETVPMYNVEKLLGYLSKLPPQAVIAKKSEDSNYTSLFLSVDGMVDKKAPYQWLVINDELEYDRFFRQNDTQTNNDFTAPALDKLLNEMTDNTSQSIERLHQWLCKQTSPDLFKGILTNGKTMGGALTYCSDKARETANNDPYAMVEDGTVFQWVTDYFTHYVLPKEKPKKRVVPLKKGGNTSPSKLVEKQKGGAEQQELALFATV